MKTFLGRLGRTLWAIVSWISWSMGVMTLLLVLVSIWRAPGATIQDSVGWTLLLLLALALPMIGAAMRRPR